MFLHFIQIKNFINRCKTIQMAIYILKSTKNNEFFYFLFSFWNCYVIFEYFVRMRTRDANWWHPWDDDDDTAIMFLPVSMQMRVLWTLAMGTVFVVLVQYQTSGTWPQQQGQLVLSRPDPVAEDLVTLALSKVVIDDDVPVSRDLLTGITRQIARYVVYSALGCTSSTYAAAASASASAATSGLSPSGGTIYVITPTYRRPEQVAELTRLAQTLMLVRDIHWLVVEDSQIKSPQLTALLQSFGIRYTHLTGEFMFQTRFWYNAFIIIIN